MLLRLRTNGSDCACSLAPMYIKESVFSAKALSIECRYPEPEGSQRVYILNFNIVA